MKKFALLTSALAIATALAVACSNTENTGNGEGTPKNVSIKLVQTVGGIDYCTSGRLQILDASGAVVVDVETDCTDTAREFLLAPATGYTTRISDPVCSVIGGLPPGALEYVDCVQGTPVPFEVTAGGTAVPVVGMLYRFRGLTAPLSVIYPAGSAWVTQASSTSTALVLCGTEEESEICATGQFCARLGTADPRCWVNCTQNAATCPTGEVCMPVYGTGVDGGPTILPSGAEITVEAGGAGSGLATVLHVCTAPVVSGAGGAGGAGG